MKLNHYTLDYEREFAKYQKLFAFYDRALITLNRVLDDEIEIVGEEYETLNGLKILKELPKETNG